MLSNHFTPSWEAARHLPVCPDLRLSCHNAGLPAYSVWLCSFNRRYYVLRWELLTSPRFVHCSARCLTDDLNSVTGLMCDNGYVAILFNVWTSCAFGIPEVYSPRRYCIVAFTFSHTYIIVCASCLVCNYFTALMNHPFYITNWMTHIR